MQNSPDSPEPIIVSAEPAKVRLTPYGTYMHGRAFQRAAERSRPDPDHMPTVTAFLYCRAIELAFKAYLLLRGQSIVREYRHDLGKLLIDTNARGIDRLITLTGRQMQLIREAGDLYSEQKLGYFDLWHATTGPKLPLDELAVIAQMLLDVLERPCMEGTDTEAWSPLPPRR